MSAHGQILGQNFRQIFRQIFGQIFVKVFGEVTALQNFPFFKLNVNQNEKENESGGTYARGAKRPV